MKLLKLGFLLIDHSLKKYHKITFFVKKITIFEKNPNCKYVVFCGFSILLVMIFKVDNESTKV